jgi:hypothetical protein
LLYTQKKFGTGFNSDKYTENYDQIDWGNSEKEEEIQPDNPSSDK